MIATPTFDDGLLLECVVTSANADGTTNVAPMGPIVDREMARVLLRPFQTSTTFANLVRERQCVLHVTDDVELIARAALHRLDTSPPMMPGPAPRTWILEDACRWFLLDVESIDDRQQRSEILCRVADRGTLREFIGFNRAMHAVIEATILATRLSMLPAEVVRAQIVQLESPVEKTGGPRERRAFALVAHYVDRFYATQRPDN